MRTEAQNSVAAPKTSDSRSSPSLGTLIDYSLPTVGIGFMFLLVNMYLMKFATDVLLIAPAAMGLIFGFSRLWDAVTDPLAGYWSDRTNTRMGRRRPWMLASIPPMGLAFYMLWNPPRALSDNGLIAWMAVGVTLFFTSMTMVLIPHQALGAELTNDHHHRTRVFGSRHLGWSVGTFLALGAMSLMIGAEEAPRQMASRVAWVAIFTSALLISWTVWRLRERPEYRGRGGENPFRAFGDVFRNRHARLLLGVFLAESFGSATINVLTAYVSDYIVGTPEKTLLYILLYAIPSAVSVPFWLRVSARVGKKRLWIFSMAVTALGFGAMFMVGRGDVWLIGSLAAVLGLGGGAGAVVAPSIQADVIDFDEVETGERKEGAYFAAWNFIFKLGFGLMLMLTGLVLDLAGFKPNQVQTPSAELALRSLYALFPMVCYLLAGFALLRFDLDEEEHRRIRQILDERSQSDLPSHGEA